MPTNLKDCELRIEELLELGKTATKAKTRFMEANNRTLSPREAKLPPIGKGPDTEKIMLQRGYTGKR